MIIHNEFQQGSDAWKEFRHGLIGGSTAEGLFVKEFLNSALFFQLLSEHCEEYVYEDSYCSAEMERGNMLEPFARQELESAKGIKLYNHGWCQSEDCAILGISPDGYTEDEKIGAEFKCPGANTHARYLCNPTELLEKYLYQVADNFAVNKKLELLYLVSYRPENRLKQMLIVEVTRETVAKIKTIGNLAEQTIVNAQLMETKIKETIDNLSF